MASSSKWREVFQKASLETGTAPKSRADEGLPPPVKATPSRKSKPGDAGVIAVPRAGVLPRNAKLPPDASAPPRKKKALPEAAEVAPRKKKASGKAAERDPEAVARGEALAARMKHALTKRAGQEPVVGFQKGAAAPAVDPGAGDAAGTEDKRAQRLALIRAAAARTDRPAPVAADEPPPRAAARPAEVAPIAAETLPVWAKGATSVSAGESVTTEMSEPIAVSLDEPVTARLEVPIEPPFEEPPVAAPTEEPVPVLIVSASSEAMAGEASADDPSFSLFENPVELSEVLDASTDLSGEAPEGPSLLDGSLSSFEQAVAVELASTVLETDAALEPPAADAHQAPAALSDLAVEDGGGPAEEMKITLPEAKAAVVVVEPQTPPVLVASEVVEAATNALDAPPAEITPGPAPSASASAMQIPWMEVDADEAGVVLEIEPEAPAWVLGGALESPAAPTAASPPSDAPARPEAPRSAVRRLVSRLRRWVGLGA